MVLSLTVLWIQQTHIPKAPKRVSFKVGGMGVQLMDKDKLLESHLYVGIVGWRYSRSEKHLVIETGKSGGASEKQYFPISLSSYNPNQGCLCMGSGIILD